MAVTRAANKPASQRYFSYGQAKSVTLDALQSILTRIEGATSDTSRLKFTLTIGWMEYDDKHPTSVTWSNGRRR